MILAGHISSILFVIAIPLFLITNAVTWAVNDLRLYEYGFDKYDVSEGSGITTDGLSSAAREIRGYFNSTNEPLEVRAEVFGVERELFNEREVQHMRDVKRLIWGVYLVDLAAAIYLTGFITVVLFMYRREFVVTLSKRLLWGSGLTVGLVALVGLVSLVGFDSLFLAFHRLSFSNDLWQLDPRSDYLIIMFPQGFWFNATIFVGLAAIVQAMIVGGVGGGLIAFRRRVDRSRREAPIQQPSRATQL